MSDETPMDIDYVANLARIELSDEENQPIRNNWEMC